MQQLVNEDISQKSLVAKIKVAGAADDQEEDHQSRIL
jgi:hypothetical protein